MAASWGKHFKSNIHGNSARNLLRCLGKSSDLTQVGTVKNLTRALHKGLTKQDVTLLQAAKKQLTKIEMRNLQKSVAVMSLSSKTTVCLGLITTSDTDVTESSEDGEDACSQGHSRKKRWKILTEIKR